MVVRNNARFLRVHFEQPVHDQSVIVDDGILNVYLDGNAGAGLFIDLAGAADFLEYMSAEMFCDKEQQDIPLRFQREPLKGLAPSIAALD